QKPSKWFNYLFALNNPLLHYLICISSPWLIKKKRSMGNLCILAKRLIALSLWKNARMSGRMRDIAIDVAKNYKKSYAFRQINKRGEEDEKIKAIIIALRDSML